MFHACSFGAFLLLHEMTLGSVGGKCKISSTRPASEVVPGTRILHVTTQKSISFEPVNVTKVARSRSRVRYIVTAHGALIVNGVLR